MFEEMVGSNGTRFILAAGAVAIGLLCLVGVLWFIRNRPSSPFIRGGKNRQPRLAVLDAAAVDTRRRLVLIRRDDVEHLILIGGPTDVVIESRIAQREEAAQPAAVPTPQAAVVTAQTMPRAAERRVPPQPETRTEPRTAPVSAMGQVLYGDDSRPVAQPVQRAAQPAQARPAAQTAAIPQRSPESGSNQQVRPAASAAVVPPVIVQSAKSPEDILDAARSRVLAVNQPAPVQRPAPEIATPAAIAATTGTSQLAGSSPQVQPQAAKEQATTDFERILDAQITGDLGKLTANEIRATPDPRSSAPAGRQEPRLDSPSADGGRTEPSLEEEMNRMLNEIAVSRKN